MRWDGLGAYRQDADTLRVFINHENGSDSIFNRVDVESLLTSQAAGITTPSDSQVTDVMDADESRINESPGIIDISEMIGECPGTYLLTSGQKETLTNNQPTLLVAPRSTGCAEIEVVM